MKTKTIIVYSFDELSESAKQTALSELYNINVDFNWWESIYEDAKNIGLEITEFDIDRGNFCKGHFIEGSEEAAERIKTGHGEQCETYKTAMQFIADKAALVSRFSDGINTDKVTEKKENDFDYEMEDLDKEFLKFLLEDYKTILRNEYAYLTSKEQIIETIKSNDYTFTESGKLENI